MSIVYNKDNKGVIRISISKENRQPNDQKKKNKRTNNDVHNIDIVLGSILFMNIVRKSILCFIYSYIIYLTCNADSSLSYICSIWAVKLRSLDTVLLYTGLTDHDIDLLVHDSWWAMTRNGNSRNEGWFHKIRTTHVSAIVRQFGNFVSFLSDTVGYIPYNMYIIEKNMHSLRNGIENLYEDSMFYLFLKLVQIFIFSENVGSQPSDMKCVNKISNIVKYCLYLWVIDLSFNQLYYLRIISDRCVIKRRYQI